MPESKARFLKQEIEQQNKALKRISRWIFYTILLDSFGVLLLYYGFQAERNWLFIGIGIVLMLFGITLTIVFGLGYHNGKKNVDKMILALENLIKSNR